jgi:hypothetical chaperone protein
MDAACGIDFGTSNSAVALSANGQARLIALQAGATSVPTALFYGFDDDSVVHGREAMRRYLIGDEGRLLRSIKSVLGTALWGETTQIKYKRYQFSDIVTSFLHFLRAATEGENGGGVERVVIGRPAFFVDDDPEADARAQDQLADAARAAGFRTVLFQLEPIAAALHYESSVAGEEIALVADIGGGTSDFSLVRVSPAAARKPDRRGDILGSNGVHIGGTDFDRLLSMASLMPHLGLRSRLKMKGMNAPSWYFSDLATWHRINFLYDAKVVAEIRSVLRDSAEPEKIERLLRVVEARKGHELLNRIEIAKIELSDAEEARVPLAAIAKGLAMKVRRARLETAIAESISRIETCIHELLRLAGIDAADVGTVFLTGGSSGVPAVRAAILGAVPEAKVVAGDAFGSVATGLALDAERRFGPSARRRKATAAK